MILHSLHTKAVFLILFRRNPYEGLSCTKSNFYAVCDRGGSGGGGSGGDHSNEAKVLCTAAAVMVMKLMKEGVKAAVMVLARKAEIMVMVVMA